MFAKVCQKEVGALIPIGLLRTGASTEPTLSASLGVHMTRKGRMEQMEWISVEDQIPYGEDRLLIVEPSRNDDPPIMAVGYYNRMMKTWLVNGERHDGLIVSHWMPLPAPPAKESDTKQV